MAAVSAPSASTAGSVSGNRGGLRAARRRKQQVIRWIILAFVAVFFLLPLVALVEFSTRSIGGGPRTLVAWKSIFSDPRIFEPLVASLELAVLTTTTALVLMVPTLIWVRLRLPRMTRVVEFFCLLPLTIPAIVLVVGWFPVYAWVWYLTGTDSILTLFFAYTVLTLPYVYRSLDAGLRAIDVRTLAEAARSLGASWPTVIMRVIVPNMRAAVLNAALLCVAIVMGEYTIASLFNYVNLQVTIAQIGLADPYTSTAVSAASLLFAFALLLVLSALGRRSERRLGRTT